MPCKRGKGAPNKCVSLGGGGRLLSFGQVDIQLEERVLKSCQKQCKDRRMANNAPVTAWLSGDQSAD